MMQVYSIEGSFAIESGFSVEPGVAVDSGFSVESGAVVGSVDLGIFSKTCNTRLIHIHVLTVD